VELDEPVLRRGMLRIIAHVLIPTIVLERISQVLRGHCAILTIGRGWQRCADRSLHPLADSLGDLDARALPSSPLAAICAGPLDPLTPALLHVTAIDWPLLIHSPGGTSLTARLGGILHPGQHYEPFSGAAELRAALESIRTNPERFAQRCARTREYLQREHNYARRLTALVQELEPQSG
jgi:hypothetical protein